ncbi:MAG: cell division protein FtsZ [Caulobacteraceae bacterium]|nr:cell division protein FtsZ [Caulobacteraceae bacterium]
MAISLSAPRATELKPRIVVFGVGGAGGNAVNNMIESGLEGVEFTVANTDAQQLQYAKTENRIQLGVSTTQGLGAGAHPEVGMHAAEESAAEIEERLEGAHMVFITAGMGGGTGTGAAPVIAKCAREKNILTVGVVTKPFMFEGRHRMRLADAGIAELQRYVDTLIVIPNQNLFRVANERTTFAEAFGMADQVLHSGVRSITDLMVLPGLINLDFADVRTVMTEMGKAMMGTGEASGEDRALMAAQNAIQNPLLDETSLKGAKAVLVNVTGGMDMTLLEVDEAANAISSEVDPEANIIFGAAFDPALQGKIRVSVVATGMDGAAISKIEPKAEPKRTLAVSDVPAPRVEPVAAAPIAEPDLIDEPVFMQSPVIQDEVRPAARAEPRIEAPASREIREPLIEQPRAAYGEERPIARIVDPLVADDEELQGDLYLDTPMARQPQPAARRPAPQPEPELEYEEPRRGGWRSLFGGRPKIEQPRQDFGRARPELRQTQQIEPEIEPEPAQPEAQDDLEIPSFLRRLAN